MYDLIVLGAGPGGYVAAIRAAQLGLKVACVDKNAQLGGTCLRVGCIPSKALLESSEHFEAANDSLADHGIDVSGVSLNLGRMLERKEKVVDQLTSGIAGLFKKNGVEGIHGTASLKDANTVVVTTDEGEKELSAKNIIIATGSVPFIPDGINADGDKIGTSTEALSYSEVPEHLVVIGAGYIGLELGTVWRRLGSKVTVLEYLDRILPGMDSDVAKEAMKLFKRQGLTFELGTKVTSANVGTTGKCVVECEGKDSIECDRVLVAVGRRPNTAGLNLDRVGVSLDDRGRVAVNDHFQTNVETIYAIGDVKDGPMLAHKAEEEGIACVEGLVTGYGHVNYNAIPGVVYTDPEIASVGKTEDQLKEEGIEYAKGLFRFKANGRAKAIDQTDGFVKMLADAKTDRILGVHIIGAHAGDLIAEAAVAIEFGASSEDIARSSHAHPTLAEAIKEAALAVDKRTIHS